MNKENLVSIVVAFVGLFSCLGLAGTQSDSQLEPRTGIEGVISVSPIHGGPSRMGEPDSRPLAHTAFVVKQGDRTITFFKTDADGRFRILLDPGHYAVSRKDWKGGVGHYGPFEVDVTAGKITKVEWTCDTGIR